LIIIRRNCREKTIIGELKKLIAGCDKLKSSIEALEETLRKIYLKKLQMRRGLLLFVLESKEKE
jgi:hypothetical protein